MQPQGHKRHPILSMFPSPLSPFAPLHPPPLHTPHSEYSPTSYAAGLSCLQYPNSEQGGGQCITQENHLLRGREGWEGGEEGGERGGRGEGGREEGRRGGERGREGGEREERGRVGKSSSGGDAYCRR